MAAEAEKKIQIRDLRIRLNKQNKQTKNREYFKFHYLLKKQNLNWITLHNTHMHVEDRKKASHPTYSLKIKKGRKRTDSEQILLYCSLLVSSLQAWNSSATTKEQSVQLVLINQSALSHIYMSSHRVWVHTHLNISYETVISFTLIQTFWCIFNLMKTASYANNAW